MVKSNPAHLRLKSLLKETITLLCKNGLEYKNEFCIEALIGITLDQDDIVLVNINETIKSAEAELAAADEPQSSHQEFDGVSDEDDYTQRKHKSPRKRLEDGSESPNSRSKRKRRRRSGGSVQQQDDTSRGSFSENEESKNDILIIKEEPSETPSSLSFDTNMPDLSWSQSGPSLSLPPNPPIHGHGHGTASSVSSSSAMFNTSHTQPSGSGPHSQSGNVIPVSLHRSADDSALSGSQWAEGQDGQSPGQSQSMINDAITIIGEGGEACVAFDFTAVKSRMSENEVAFGVSVHPDGAVHQCGVVPQLSRCGLKKKYVQLRCRMCSLARKIRRDTRLRCWDCGDFPALCSLECCLQYHSHGLHIINNRGTLGEMGVVSDETQKMWKEDSINNRGTLGKIGVVSDETQKKLKEDSINNKGTLGEIGVVSDDESQKKLKEDIVNNKGTLGKIGVVSDETQKMWKEDIINNKGTLSEIYVVSDDESQKMWKEEYVIQ